MATPKRTQKQTPERYKGNLGYYKKRHPWRIARSWATILAFAGGLAAFILFQRHGNQEFFSSGKLSSNHAALVQDCAKCHEKSLGLARMTFVEFKGLVK